MGCAPACDHDLDLLGELLDLVRMIEKPLLRHAQQDDDRGDDRPGDVGDGADRAVGPEVGDSPAPAVQGDPERQQAEFMLLAGYAGQDGPRTLALSPALGKAEEASSDEVRGEVLVGDRHLAGLPTLPQAVEIGKDDRLQDRLDGVGGKELVEGGVGGLLIQPVE
jgi:hypothetical protein